MKLYKFLFVIGLCALSTSCIGEKKMDIIYYKSEEFDSYVKHKAKISPAEALSLAQKYRKKNMDMKAGKEYFL